MSKLCLRTFSSSQQFARSASTSFGGATSQPLGSSSSSAGAGAATAAAAASRFYKANGLLKPAAKMLPPTQPRAIVGYGNSGTILIQQQTNLAHQQQATRYGHIALRARLSPAMSLFNRLDEFVTQLETSRDFFVEWPQNLCHRIRQDAINGNNNKLFNSNNNNNNNNRVSSTSVGQQAIQNYSSLELINLAYQQQQQQQQQQLSNGVCWNGVDFGGYNKPLVPFGQAINSNHPEVPMSKTDPYNTIVLDFVAKLKDIGAQLARKATHSSSNLYQALVLSTKTNENKSQLQTDDDDGDKINNNKQQQQSVRSVESQFEFPTASSLLSSAEILSAAAAAESDSALDEEDSSASGSLLSPTISSTSESSVNFSKPTPTNGDSSGKQNNDNSQTTNNEDGELESTDGDNNNSNNNNNEQGEGEEEDEEDSDDGNEFSQPPCNTSDCIDLFTNPANNHNNIPLYPTIVDNNNNPNYPPAHNHNQQQFPKPLDDNFVDQRSSSSQLPPSIVHIQQSGIPITTKEDTPIFDREFLPNGRLSTHKSIVISTNSSPSSSSSSTTSSLFDIYNIGSFIIILMVFTISIIIAKKAFKRKQILVV